MDVNELAEWARSLDREEVYEMSTDDRFSGAEKKFLYDAAGRISRGDTLTTKQMQWLHSLFTKRTAWSTASAYGSEKEYVAHPDAALEHRHLCVRLAWHDSAWNGALCTRPADNVYCVGEHSLLSDRLRRRRDLAKEEPAAGASGNDQALGHYQPPCFWSINAFGKRQLVFSHDNPAESSYPHIKETLPPYSVISWPFDLAFVRDNTERQKLGSYYPKALFERRIRDFHARVVEGSSIVFLYCKFSNPVSGDDSDYLLVGCGLVSGKGALNWFNVSDSVLRATKEKKREPNFPTLNWALRFSMDFERTGVRIPYQEYLGLINVPGGLPQQYLDDIKVVVREPELIDGFTYVAKHVDDDQAIFLLMKLRQSLLEVKRHGVLPGFDVDTQLKHIDFLLDHAWNSRGYLPGFRGAAMGLLGRNTADTRDIDAFVAQYERAAPETITKLDAILHETEGSPGHERLVGDLLDRLERHALSPTQFLRLASLNLTPLQFARILGREGSPYGAGEIADNPYLLFESYAPQEKDKDRTSGEKIDSVVDLFKIDIALFPQRRHLPRSPTFHDWKVGDPRRVRSVLIALLRQLESRGHCYDTAEHLSAGIARYPLFYEIGDEYKPDLNLASPQAALRSHLEKEVVATTLDGRSVYYLKSVYDDEKYVANVIDHLVAAADNSVNVPPGLVGQAAIAAKGLKTKLGARFRPEDFVEERKRLYSILPYRKFSILTGSPGAGKSYELLKLVSFLSTLQERYLILSLTGKAALRLRNNELGVKNVHAKTFDKFLVELERQKGVKSIVHNLIIEEASMADLTKLAAVLRAVDPHASHFRRLILVGDENQLPPIGYGKPFADIVDSLKADGARAERHHVSLATNCRAELPEEFVSLTNVFANNSKMGERVLADLVKNKKAPGILVRTYRDKSDLYAQIREEFLSVAGHPPTLNAGLDVLLKLSGDMKSRPTGLENFQVLSPYRAGYSGVSGLNLLFQSEYRTTERYTRKVGDISFKLGDKLMHTKNEYSNDELLVSNGSLGVASDYGKVFFADQDSPTPFSALRYLEDLELAYAVTVHKSQGSGFGHVFVVVPNRTGLLSRELVFTALTRTKTAVTLFVEANGDTELAQLIDKIRNNSAIASIRTSLAVLGAKRFAYVPADGVEVKSRVEYIIYRKLTEAANRSGTFTFKYEQVYELAGRNFNLRPDFTIWLQDGRTIYWEHLGRLNDRSYVKSWDSRRAIYEEKGDLDKVMTTDELKGISDEKIEAIITNLVGGDLATEDRSNRYSRLHYSLR
ncbi:MAG: ATP-dependent RecD-like DNA helicase [Anaeromyxobacteraceae bacterium]